MKKRKVLLISNVAFEKRSNNEKSSLNEVIENTDLKEDYKMVVFDLETSGRKKNSDILQLAAIVQENVFSVYVTPTQDVDKFASEINGLHNIGRELYLRNEKLLTLSMVDALQAFYAFLCKVGKSKKCILIAHNASFDISFF
ncbi:DNA polymerase III polC-type [Camponotus floridanus]|uniref:DNA polymerase III polC-type n=1 Tax=Camponotus floridanus TaxID=104421 RepID=E2AJG4_CAMFO|nr:DNA polymerase III polC-type [Camponotus floridanus]